MTADATYGQGVVNIRQDGSLYVPTGKSVSIESGGSLLIEAGGQVAEPVTVLATTVATVFNNHGLVVMTSTANGIHTLAAPSRAGLRVILANSVHGATTVTKTVTTTGATITGGTTGTTTIATFTSAIQSLSLISTSTANWHVTSNVNSVAFS
jgi:hypothetical protein